jgi:hypothetical protein
MESNLDLNTFYHHALQWKHRQDEAEQLAEQERQRNIKGSWETIARVIREALPIEGMTLHETEANQFDHAPLQGRLIDVDCCLDPQSKERLAHGDGELIDGVIRVRILWDMVDAFPDWKILKYIVLVDRQMTDFANPYAAFLAAYGAYLKGAENRN